MIAYKGTQLAPIVVKVGGGAIEAGALAQDLWNAVAALHASDPVGVVVVHGGGSVVDERLSRMGIVSERREGVRITPPAMLEEVVAGLAGVVNTAVLGRLSAAGAKPVGLTLADGGLTSCVTTRSFGFDAGRVGEVTGGDASLAQTLLAGGFLPVVCSIGLDEAGEPLNINADDAASAIARVLGARMLLMLTGVDAVLDASGEPIATLDASSAAALIAEGQIEGGMIPKVRGALSAAEASGAAVTIASWRSPEALVSFARGGAPAFGTHVLPSAFISPPAFTTAPTGAVETLS